MEWSYSGSKAFYRCQRRWYFQTVVPNPLPNAKNRLRREAFFLSQLQSIEEWRGSLVDKVIEKLLVPQLNKKGIPTERQVLNYARRLFDSQLAFARGLRSREEGMTKTKGDEEYAALFNVEYGVAIQAEELEQAWVDIQTALRNLLNDDELMSQLRQANYLIAQRKLRLDEDEFTVTAVPDLIAFYRDAPPTIYDWKVHSRAEREYWLQLACYALALTRGKSYSDYSGYDVSQYEPTQIPLAEVQLLVPQTRWYHLTDDDVFEVENYIYSTGIEMLSSLGDEGNEQLRPLEFRATQYPEENCTRCGFQKLCGADSLWMK